MAQTKDPNKFLPLTEATSYILLALDEPLHGYGVMQKINQLSEGTVRVWPGTFNGAFTTLGWDGLIAKVGDEEPRKIFRLTSLGRQDLQAQIKRISILIRHAQATHPATSQMCDQPFFPMAHLQKK